MAETLLAILDFVPCVLCFIAMLKLQKLLYHQMSKYSFGMLAAGSFMVLVAGTLKATWKLFYYASSGNIDLFRLNFQMIPIEAVGFMFVCVSLIIMIYDFKHEKKNEVKSNAFVPFGFIILAELIPYLGEGLSDPSNWIFLSLLTIGTVGFYACIVVILFKKEKPLMAVLMIIAAILMIMMCALGSKFDGKPLLNLMAELINTSAQAIFLISIITLEKVDISNLKEIFIK